MATFLSELLWNFNVLRTLCGNVGAHCSWFQGCCKGEGFSPVGVGGRKVAEKATGAKEKTSGLGRKLLDEKRGRTSGLNEKDFRFDPWTECEVKKPAKRNLNPFAGQLRPLVIVCRQIAWLARGNQGVLWNSRLRRSNIIGHHLIPPAPFAWICTAPIKAAFSALWGDSYFGLTGKAQQVKATFRLNGL